MAAPAHKNILEARPVHVVDGNRGHPCLAVRNDWETNQTLTAGEAAQLLVVGEAIRATLMVNAANPFVATGADLFHARDKSYAVVAIHESHSVAEGTAVTSNLKIERCQGTEAAAAGDDLLAATDIDLKATANTPQTGAVLVAASINILAVGDRLVAHSAVDAGTAGVTTEYEGLIEVELVPVALSVVSTT